MLSVTSLIAISFIAVAITVGTANAWRTPVDRRLSADWRLPVSMLHQNIFDENHAAYDSLQSDISYLVLHGTSRGYQVIVRTLALSDGGTKGMVVVTSPTHTLSKSVGFTIATSTNFGVSGRIGTVTFNVTHEDFNGGVSSSGTIRAR
jgi:hypothetical protein